MRLSRIDCPMAWTGPFPYPLVQPKRPMPPRRHGPRSELSVPRNSCLLTGARVQACRPKSRVRCAAGGRMEPKALISIYDNRWKQIQHLNELDLRSLVLVVTAVSGAVVSERASPHFPVILEVGVACLATVVCAGGIYSTTDNRIGMDYALAAIDFVETELNRELPGLFRYAGNYRAPGTMWKFVKRIARSIRGPILAFFAVGLTASIAVLAHGMFRISRPPPYERVLSVSAGVVVSVLTVRAHIIPVSIAPEQRIQIWM